MELTRTAYGTWSGGRFMHFGESLEDDRFLGAIRHAYDWGIRTFLTADVYGNGLSDEMLARALEGIPRDSYCLVGAVGHDFYGGTREGAKGYPRFTDPRLRSEDAYADYLRMAVDRSLERCRTTHFDCLLLHNPDSIGYTSEAVWTALQTLRDDGLTTQLGIAPGPANGFTLDLLECFERFGSLLDWAMVILNPLEPWPGTLCLPAAKKYDIKVLTRVVDYGGLFHGDVKPGHPFGPRDHRTFRPAGWVEAGNRKLDLLRPFAEAHGLTLLQLACLWNLSHPGVQSVVPTMIQEAGENAKSIECKIDELAALPERTLTADEIAQIRAIGENAGCMDLKGANPEHLGESLPDRWEVRAELLEVAQRWGIDPTQDLVRTHAL